MSPQPLIHLLLLSTQAHCTQARADVQAVCPQHETAVASEITWRSSAGGVGRHPAKIPRSGRSKSSSEEPENPRAELILLRYRQVRNPASSQIGVGKAEVSDQPANLALVAEHPAIEPGFYRHPCMPRAGKGHRSPPLVCRPSALDFGQTPTSPHLTRQRLAPRLPI